MIKLNNKLNKFNFANKIFANNNFVTKIFVTKIFATKNFVTKNSVTKIFATMIFANKNFAINMFATKNFVKWIKQRKRSKSADLQNICTDKGWSTVIQLPDQLDHCKKPDLST